MNVEQLMKQPKVHYKRAPFGPVTVQRHDDRTTADSPVGSVVVGACSWAGAPTVADALQAGVPVTVDGEQVAVARQRRSASTSVREPILLEPTGSLPIPAGCGVTKKGFNGIHRMVADQGVLISHPFPGWWNRYSRVHIADGVDPRLAVIFAAIAFGLDEALGL